jgi:hypothetical protein
MARPNYGAAKRTKELKRKAKREAKLARKHARRADHDRAEPTMEPAPQAGSSGDAPAETAPTSVSE